MGMDIAAKNLFGIVQNGAAVVGQNDLHLTATALDQLFVIGDVVHPGKGVAGRPEQLMKTLFGEHIGPGIDSLFIQCVQIHQMISHFIGRIAEHKYDFFGAHGDALEAHGKTVAAEDGENHAHGLSAEFALHILGDLLHGGIVALGPGYHRFGHGDDILVMNLKAAAFRSAEHAVHYDLADVVPFPDDGGPNAPGNGSH